MTFSFSNESLTTQVTKVDKTKYFPVELYCTNMVPGTKYNVFYDGINVNGFCKPFGGNLGDSLISDQTGRLIVLFLVSMQYKTQYLVAQTPNANILSITKKIELVNAQGTSSITYLPLVLKAG